MTERVTKVERVLESRPPFNAEATVKMEARQLAVMALQHMAKWQFAEEYVVNYDSCYMINKCINTDCSCSVWILMEGEPFWCALFEI